MAIHGGDIYRNHVNIDFSVNVNPLGIPKEVKTALYQAVELCEAYPDMEAQELKNAVSNMQSVKKEYLLFGNGASELFMAVVHGIKPKKTVIVIPSFYGYEYAVKALDQEILYYKTKEKYNFCITRDIYSILTPDVELLIFANPNNPTGTLLEKEVVKELLNYCEERDIYTLLDESFIEFSKEQVSMISELKQLEHLILIRTFTKIFSIPGVRLGYLICNNNNILKKVKQQLPEWNLSCFAQKAGIACSMQKEFIEKTKQYIKTERQFLEYGLKEKGFLVFPSMANFILIYKEEAIYEKLLEKGILIRDCRNFRGLYSGFYRIAVKTREENELLLKALEDRE